MEDRMAIRITARTKKYFLGLLIRITLGICPYPWHQNSLLLFGILLCLLYQFYQGNHFSFWGSKDGFYLFLCEIFSYELPNIEFFKPAIKYLSTGLFRSCLSAIGECEMVSQHSTVCFSVVVLFYSHSTGNFSG